MPLNPSSAPFSSRGGRSERVDDRDLCWGGRCRASASFIAIYAQCRLHRSLLASIHRLAQPTAMPQTRVRWGLEGGGSARVRAEHHCALHTAGAGYNTRQSTCKERGISNASTRHGCCPADGQARRMSRPLSCYTRASNARRRWGMPCHAARHAPRRAPVSCCAWPLTRRAPTPLGAANGGHWPEKDRAMRNCASEVGRARTSRLLSLIKLVNAAAARRLPAAKRVKSAATTAHESLLQDDKFNAWSCISCDGLCSTCRGTTC